MPARKPRGLITRDQTKADTAARDAAESALEPKTVLQKSEPAALKDHRIAASEWRRLIKLYNELEGTIVTSLDQGMLLDYCILIEQLAELDDLRSASIEDWKNARKVVAAFEEQVDEDPEKKIDLKTFIKAAEAVNWAYDKIVKLDGRVDRKRALLLQLRQSLYLTPRSRAGVAPTEKPEERAKGDMDEVLDGE